MSNPPKRKGTAGETEIIRFLELMGLSARRTPPGSKWDIEVAGDGEHSTMVEALATRPDRGRWLVTITLSDFIQLLLSTGRPARIESKRYQKFSLHTIYHQKFGGGP